VPLYTVLGNETKIAFHAQRTPFYLHYHLIEKKFEWLKGPDAYFVARNSSGIGFGVGSNGFGLMITSDGKGSSTSIEQYENDLLNGEDSELFDCKIVEVEKKILLFIDYSLHVYSK